MSISSALELARTIERVAVQVASETTAESLNTTVTELVYLNNWGDKIELDLTQYAPKKFIGIARYNNLIGRVRVDNNVAHILSIECDRRAQ